MFSFSHLCQPSSKLSGKNCVVACFTTAKNWLLPYNYE
jgi:hypothetical protein